MTRSQLAQTAILILLGSFAMPTVAESARRRNRRSQKPGPNVVAIVSDMPIDATPEIAKMVKTIEAETDLLLKGTGRSVAFPPDKQWISQWDQTRIRQNADAALADPDVDIVLAFGLATALYLIHKDVLPKPVLIPMAPDPRFSGSPVAGDASGKKNLAYLAYPGSVHEDLKLLQQLTRAKVLHVLIDGIVPNLLPKIGDIVKSVSDDIEIPLRAIIAAPSVPETLARIPEDVEALYVGTQVRLSHDQRKELIDGLIAKKVPTFSMRGRIEVDQGMLATKTRGADMLKLARRTAFNIERILQGEDPATFTYKLTRQGKLLLNMKTARAIGFSPTWDILNYAQLEQQVDEEGTPYTLNAAITNALELNWDILAAEEGVEAQRNRRNAAYGNLAPQIGFEFSHQTIRKQSAEASIFRPEHQGKIAGTLNQTLYREPIYADIGIQKHRLQSQQATYEIVKLDVVADVATAFIDLLRAQAIAKIQRANAELTAENLEMSKVRRQVGVEGPSDYYRWVSKLATDRQGALQAETNVKIAQIQLARAINLPQNQPFIATPMTLRDPTLLPMSKDLQRFYDTPATFAVFSDFLVKEGRETTPDLEELSATIEAKQREYQSRFRVLFLPEFFINGEISYLPYRSFASGGPANIPGFDPDDDIPRFDWFIGGGVTLPVFTGLRQSHERDQAERELNQLQRQYESRGIQVEARIRSALADVRNRRTAIELAHEAAEAARENLRVVQDGYRRGVASTIDLLDAQNQALSTEQSAATAINEYHKAVVELQRAIANFQLFTTTTERETWLDRLKEFFATNSGQ